MCIYYKTAMKMNDSFFNICSIKFDVSTTTVKCHVFTDVSVGEFRAVKYGRCELHMAFNISGGDLLTHKILNAIQLLNVIHVHNHQCNSRAKRV